MNLSDFGYMIGAVAYLLIKSFRGRKTSNRTILKRARKP